MLWLGDVAAVAPSESLPPWSTTMDDEEPEDEKRGRG